MVGMTPPRDNALTLDRLAQPLPMIVGMPEYFEGVPILYGTINSTWWVPHDTRPVQELGAQIAVTCPFCTALRNATGHRRKLPVRNLHGWDMRHGLGVISHREAHSGCHHMAIFRKWPLGPCCDGYYVSLDPRVDHPTRPGECEIERPMPASRIRGAR